MAGAPWRECGAVQGLWRGSGLCGVPESSRSILTNIFRSSSSFAGGVLKAITSRATRLRSSASEKACVSVRVRGRVMGQG